jgi:hypothetical protein
MEQMPVGDLRTGTIGTRVVAAEVGNGNEGPGFAAQPETLGA